MKTTKLLLSMLIFAAPFSAAGGRGGSARASGRRTFSHRGGLARPMSRPAPARATVASASSRGGFAAVSSRRRFAAATSGAPTTGSSNAQAASAAVGSKILTAGYPPTYSAASGGGTLSVNGGGFVTIDQSRALDVGRSPGITWGAPDRAISSGSGAGGSGGSSNGPAFDPSF
ncbi:MAG: hypothetical protein ACHQ49_11185 [Elusimicrobiota bacterium]